MYPDMYANNINDTNVEGAEQDYKNQAKSVVPLY